MQRREKILAGTAGGVALLAVLWFLFSGNGPSSGNLRTQRDNLAAEVKKKEITLRAAKADKAKFDEWQRRALPSNKDAATSKYQSWILALADKEAGFGQLKVTPGTGSSPKGVYSLLKFTIHGRATLAKVTKFLYAFYSAGHLHQITSLELKPVEKSPELEVTIQVDAMSLPGADRKEELSKEPGKSLLSAKLDDYADIAKRNLFAPFSGAPKPPPNNFDPALYTYVTGILEVDGHGQVWLQDRSGGRTWKLHEGEDFQVGALHGNIKSISCPHEVTIDFGGQAKRFNYGENLRQGVEVPGQGVDVQE